jgi:hypothetical protein
MRPGKLFVFLTFPFLFSFAAHPATHYVDINTTNATAPFTSWATAATDIQAAVDVATNGDIVLVNDGVYWTGGRSLGTLTNRVAVTNAIMLASVNGPQLTLIEGYQVPGTTNGSSAARCVYLADGATLSGFTLTNGATGPGGSDGEWESWGGGVHCETSASIVTNCIIINNSAGDWSGGADNGTLNNCALINNNGGGYGGYGGGALGANLRNCFLTGNVSGSGGAVAYCALTNCTITGNFGSEGGGANSCTLFNSIVYYNHATSNPDNSGCVMNYSCTPLAAAGTNNITDDPQLASVSHLSAGSACRGAGGASFAFGSDFDGEPWGTPPDIGCDEYNVATTPLSLSVLASFTNVATGFDVDFTEYIVGACAASRIDFGDGTIISNRPYASHRWSAGGQYAVTLRAYNAGHPAGVDAVVNVQVTAQPICYVSLSSSNPVSPYASWTTAATNIQDAVDASIVGGTVLVNDGIYQTGATLFNASSNRVAAAKPVKVSSVNGPNVTSVNGNQGVRCFYLADHCTLSGFTVTGGAADAGGGVECETPNVYISNCIFLTNSANSGSGLYGGTASHCVFRGNALSNYGSSGGAVCNSALDNCILYANFASYGGAAYNSMLTNCTLVMNSADIYGGATAFCALYNCINFFGGDTFDSSLDKCCSDSSDAWSGFFTEDPRFVDLAAGDFHLQTNSPCINSGRNSSAITSATDLDGNSRITGGTVDIGAFEFQSPTSQLSYQWLQQYGLPTDGSADLADTDTDGMSNWQEWLAGTDPTNAASALRLLSVDADPDSSGLLITWQSAGDVAYSLQKSTNLLQQPFITIQTNIGSQGDTTTVLDESAASAPASFYRVLLEPNL